MYIIPRTPIIRSIGDVPGIDDPRRVIFINLHPDRGVFGSVHDFVLINSCRQTGSVGGKLSSGERLYSYNVYFGVVALPFDHDGDLNKFAVVDIHEYNFTNKIVKYQSDREMTVNFFDTYYGSGALKYRNGDEILPSDPRFYNIDHQILKTRTDRPFHDEKHELTPYIAGWAEKHMFGMSRYLMSELIDEYTTITTLDMSFDNTFDLISGVNTDFKRIVGTIVSDLVLASYRAMMTEFKAIFEYDVGQRFFDYKYRFDMDKSECIDEIISLSTMIEESYTKMLELDLRIRISIIHNESMTRVRVTPLDHDECWKNNQSSYNMQLVISESLFE